MKAYVLLGLTFSAASIISTGAMAALAEETTPQPKASITAYFDCLKATDNELRTGHATPERYAMGFDGACLMQYETATRQMKASLEAIPHSGVSYEDAQEITANSMAAIQTTDERLRKQYVSAYVLWYVSAERTNSKVSR